ncbi:MAG: DNA cytosine methyltransferase, partial [Verrucomicrobiota bacterium]
IQSKSKTVGTLYRRTRNGQQRAEVRFDIAGCLRTPAGGSSRQTLVVVHRGKVRTRLLSAREAARLMGIPDSYQLPKRYNDAYHLAGDGVVVPVVRYLAKHALEPIIGNLAKRKPSR